MCVQYTAIFEDTFSGSPVTYGLVESRVDTGEGVHTRFGVSVEYSGQRATYPDVFGERKKAEAFIALLHRGLVTPVTLADVVGDRLYVEEFG